MSSRGYTVLGWIVWHVGKRYAGYELRHNAKTRARATAVVLGVLIAGALAAKAAAPGDDD